MEYLPDLKSIFLIIVGSVFIVVSAFVAYYYFSKFSVRKGKDTLNSAGYVVDPSQHNTEIVWDVISSDLVWIDKQLAWLAFRFPQFLERELFVCPVIRSIYTEDDSIMSMVVDDFSRCILSREQTPTVQLVFIDEKKSLLRGENRVATIRHGIHGKSRITINVSKKYKDCHYHAIIAHELTHEYLFRSNISLPDNYDNERFTDLAAVYFGFGIFLMEGYEKITYNVSNDNFYHDIATFNLSIGYLPPRYIACALIRLSEYRNISVETLIRHVPARFKSTIDDALEHLSKYRKSLQRYEVLICDQCRQNIRVPKLNRNISVTCPSCKNTFTYLSNSGD